jgi:superfamily II DNA or RNA helicase
MRRSAETPGIQETYARLMADQNRNDLILDDLIASLEEGRSPMLLTERRDHVEAFANRLQNVARNVVALKGGGGAKARRKAVEELAEIPDSEERVVLATGRFVGEGFDDPRLDTLFLALPIAWKGTLVQYAGRLHRRHQGKTEVRIYDYVDEARPALHRMFEKRLKGYRAMGYEVDHSDPSPESAGREYVIEYEDR